MFRSARSLGVLGLAVAWLGNGCGGSTGPSDSDEASGGTFATGGQRPDGSGGLRASGGTASMGPAASGGALASGGQGGEEPSGVEAPKLIGDPHPEATFPGTCTETPLGEFIESVHENWPELADIDFLAPADIAGDPPQQVFALISSDGWALALKRGSGDCPAGCIDETFWYFESGAACQPVFLGSYSALYDAEGNCYDVEGSPMWNLGRAVSASSRCDFDPTALDISDTYEVSAGGLELPCPETESAEWNRPFTFVVKQDPANPARAEVEFKNVHPKLEGGKWPGEVTAKELRVEFTSSKSSCFDDVEIQFHYDVEEGKGSFRLFEAASLDCQNPSADICKGSIELTLEE